MYNEIRAKGNVPAAPPGCVGAVVAAKEWGISEFAARQRLARMVRERRAEMVPVKWGAREIKFYRLKGK